VLPKLQSEYACFHCEAFIRIQHDERRTVSRICGRARCSRRTVRGFSQWEFLQCPILRDLGLIQLPTRSFLDFFARFQSWDANSARGGLGSGVATARAVSGTRGGFGPTWDERKRSQYNAARPLCHPIREPRERLHTAGRFAIDWHPSEDKRFGNHKTSIFNDQYSRI
jgi:hypothetical protein